MFTKILKSALMVCLCSAGFAKEVEILYLKIPQEQAPTLSNLDPIPDDLGLGGAELGVFDNNTTGRFLDYSFALRHVETNFEDAKSEIADASESYVLLDMSAEQIHSIATGISGKLFFNVSAYDDEIRAENCLSYLLHTLPSYAMRADAISQFLVFKRWTKIAIIEGSQNEDAAFARAIRHSATKFGLTITADETWIFDEDMRRNASAEVPLFTQKLGDYDALIIADERNDFARYLAYNTWTPRPIFGADGLKSVGWSNAMEQWGAAQLQSRFKEQAGREMQDQDYAAWAALRAIDEAFIRTNQGQFNDVHDYLLSENFELAGFKGNPLSFRKWDGQMRQPIGLVTSTAAIAFAPIEGFLHAHNPLDSLGYDQPETGCKNFGD